MKSLSYILIIIFVSFFACKKGVDPNYLKETVSHNLVLGDTAVIKILETSINDEIGVSILMDSVLNESRCPIGVYCFWAGNAAVRFVFKSNNQEVKFALNTTLSPGDAVINGYKISLINLLPYPVAAHPTSYNDYHAVIKVQKN